MKKTTLTRYLALVFASILAAGPVAAITCNTGNTLCDRMASQLDDHLMTCTVGSGGSCGYTVSDALVNCQVSEDSSCDNTGTALSNVSTITFVGHCDPKYGSLRDRFGR